MKHRPCPFGFPAWRNCKKRVAKKYLNRSWKNKLYKVLKRYASFHLYKDNLISDCSGLNMRFTSIEPNYLIFGKNSEVLLDIDFIGPTNSCSFYHCGIGWPKTKKECEDYIKGIIDYYSKHGDSYGFVERYSKLILHEDGTFEWPVEKETVSTDKTELV